MLARAKKSVSIAGIFLELLCRVGFVRRGRWTRVVAVGDLDRDRGSPLKSRRGGTKCGIHSGGICLIWPIVFANLFGPVRVVSPL